MSREKRWCYDCVNYLEYGWGDCTCQIYGFMGAGQDKMHPDVSANTCKKYNEVKGKPLYRIDPKKFVEYKRGKR